jgi:NTP pyrophosphatase (non-canonical NTP hydrolase)
MNWSEYKELSEKTLSREFHCQKNDEFLLHAVSGIITELDELLDNHLVQEDSINILEECGDITWYLAIIGRELNLEFPDVKSKQMPDCSQMDFVLKMLQDSIKLLDFLKKKLYYNKPIDLDKFKTLSESIFTNLIFYTKFYKIDIEESFDINISKLKARYGDKFSSERAINRQLDIEREILENKK